MTALAPMRAVISATTEHGQDVYALACGHEKTRFHRHNQPAKSRCDACLAEAQEGAKAAAFGKLVLSAMDEIRRMEAALPGGFEACSMTNDIETADGERWKNTVERCRGIDGG